MPSSPRPSTRPPPGPSRRSARNTAGPGDARRPDPFSERPAPVAPLPPRRVPKVSHFRWPLTLGGRSRPLEVSSAKSMGNSPRTHEQSLRCEQPYRLTVENQAMLIPKRWRRSGRTGPTRRMSISVGTIPQSLSSRYFKPSIIDQGLMPLISVSFIMGNGCTS